MEHYEELLALAEEIATKAHSGQVDKAGVAYINHPKTVASYCTSIYAKIVGWLHDVIEDTDVTMDDLKQKGFDAFLLEALDCVTKPKTGYDEDVYYARIKNNDIAKEVKLADLKHNSDMSRIPQNITPEEREKMIKKKKFYQTKIQYLKEE
nr:GTP pyrophosphokinase [Lachnospiraceae bacterium]